jgi:ATP-dependent RNA helicase DbpA
MTEFSALALIGPLQRGLKEVGYAQMTPVQAASLPAILAGRDVAAQALQGLRASKIKGRTIRVRRIGS